MVATTDDAFTKRRRDGEVANVIVRGIFLWNLWRVLDIGEEVAF